MSDMTINKPVVVFNFTYWICTEPKGETDVVVNHPEMMGTINNDGSIVYPTIENVEEFLMKELITGHKLKQFRIDDSTFCVLSPNRYQYITYDFNSLPVIVDDEPEDLINGIIQHVIKRTMGGK